MPAIPQTLADHLEYRNRKIKDGPSDLAIPLVMTDTNMANRTNITNGIAPSALPLRGHPNQSEEFHFISGRSPLGHQWEEGHSPSTDLLVESEGDTAGYSITEQPEDEDAPRWALNRVDAQLWDNGELATDGKTKHTRYKAKVRISPEAGASYVTFGCSFNNRCGNFFSTLPHEFRLHDFYHDFLQTVSDFRQYNRKDFHIKPLLGKLKDGQNHVVPLTAVIMWQWVDQPVMMNIILMNTTTSELFFDEVIDLDDENPKGKAKCDAMKAIGYWQNPDTVGNTRAPTARGIEHAFAANKNADALRGK